MYSENVKLTVQKHCLPLRFQYSDKVKRRPNNAALFLSTVYLRICETNLVSESPNLIYVPVAKALDY